MKRLIVHFQALLFSLFFGSGAVSLAQTTLEYSNALIVKDVVQTIPTGKVWKVTAIYGSDRFCVQGTSNYINKSDWGYSKYVANISSAMIVNGVNIFSLRVWDVSGSYITLYNDAACTSNYCSSCPGRGPYAYDIAANPNILPQWLPAGTTVQTGSPNVLISVLEFNVNP